MAPVFPLAFALLAGVIVETSPLIAGGTPRISEGGALLAAPALAVPGFGFLAFELLALSGDCAQPLIKDNATINKTLGKMLINFFMKLPLCGEIEKSFSGSATVKVDEPIHDDTI